jgi:hypothetical protein
MVSSDSFTNDLDQHPLPSPAVKLPVEDALPRAEVETAVGHRDHHLAAHHLALQMRVGIVLARPIVPILVDRCMRRQLFEPDLVVMVQATLVVVDEYAGSNVLRIYKGQSPLCGIPLSCL